MADGNVTPPTGSPAHAIPDRCGSHCQAVRCDIDKGHTGPHENFAHDLAWVEAEADGNVSAAPPYRTAEPETLRAVAATLFEHNPSSWRTPGNAPLHLYDLRVSEEMVDQYEDYARKVLNVIP